TCDTCYQVLPVNYTLLFFFQAEDGIRDRNVTGVQTCALPIFTRTVYGAKMAARNPPANTDGNSMRLTLTPAAVMAKKEMMPASETEERRVGKECRDRWRQDQ